MEFDKLSPIRKILYFGDLILWTLGACMIVGSHAFYLIFVLLAVVAAGFSKGMLFTEDLRGDVLNEVKNEVKYIRHKYDFAEIWAQIGTLMEFEKVSSKHIEKFNEVFSKVPMPGDSKKKYEN